MKPVNGVREAAILAILWTLVVVMLVLQLGKLWWNLGGPRDAVLHLGLALCLVLADWARRRNSTTQAVVSCLMIGLTLVASLYMISVWLNFQQRAIFPEPIELVFGLSLTAIVLVVTWERYGALFPCLALIGLAWALFGEGVLPAFLAPARMDMDEILGQIISDQAGGVIHIFAQYVWLILFFGALIELSGAGRIMWWAARAVGRMSSAGPALGAVIASALAGTFLGSGGSSVAVTGPVTIPAMKKAGYTPEEAAAIEAVAADAAGITPPILGTVAFIMADLIGVSYGRIVAAVLIPAALWYVCVAIFLIAMARRKGRNFQDQIDAIPAVSSRDAFRSLVLLGLPLTTLIVLAIESYSLRIAILVALAELLVLTPFLGQRRNLSEWVRGIQRGVIQASEITVVVGCVMIFFAALQATGLDSRIGDIILTMTGSSYFAAIVAIWIAGIVLGAGLPPLAIYFILVISIIPVLTAHGMPPLQSHFVAYIMGLTSFIIPPVATAVLIASGIAQSNYMRSCMQAIRTDTVILMLPLYILVAPELLLDYADLTSLFVITITCTLGMVAMALASAGWAGVSLSMPVRVLLAAVPFCQIIGIGMDLPAAVATASIVAVAIVGYGLIAGRMTRLRTAT